VWPSNLDVAASGSQVVAAYSGHRDVAMLRSLLVHGVAAAVALAVVVLALGQAAHGRAGFLSAAVNRLDGVRLRTAAAVAGPATRRHRYQLAASTGFQPAGSTDCRWRRRHAGAAAGSS
jgi:hypothetical protein